MKSADNIGSAGRRILVVDDEPIVSDSIRRLLLADGYRVETAASAEEALERFGREKFDLIITDYEMPLKKGDQLAAAIKAIDPNQPVAMITAYAEAIVRAHIPLGNVDFVMEKPFGWAQFRQIVAKLLAPKPISERLTSKCDNLETDAAKHAGPFELLMEDSRGAIRTRLERCDSCGNMVVRYVTEELSGAEESEASRSP